ncbi:unnamed protein product [Cylindrotheca closterium]|uniref:Glutamine amidotransferase type-2 domain-containing protein n=1 Tax=Cylindrotheca closterium TaxID=2856 RepID=A0AAD2CUM8_9STRA|nr:unnamed protein product [Cylindrotheca closterium]
MLPISMSPPSPHHQQRRIVHQTQSALLCQLLGMNCATPTDFNFSFSGFCRRGGETDIHQDGWGIVIYENGSLRQFHDAEPASTSLLADFVCRLPIRTLNMMSHIRFATVGEVNLSNVHPFRREMWGIDFCFAHNGEVPLFDQCPNHCLTSLLQDDDEGLENVYYYNPVGTTDSEATFCAILNALRQKFDKVPSVPVLYDSMQKLCDEIVDSDREGTILNFLLTCGSHTLWVYSWPGSRPGSKVWNGLHYTTREYPFHSHHLCDVDITVDFSTRTSKEDCVSVIATKPLTDDEEWTELERGELVLFDRGRPQRSVVDLFQVDIDGHGLQSNVVEKSSIEDDMKTYNIDPSTFQGACI